MKVIRKKDLEKLFQLESFEFLKNSWNLFLVFLFLSLSLSLSFSVFLFLCLSLSLSFYPPPPLSFLSHVALVSTFDKEIKYPNSRLPHMVKSCLQLDSSDSLFRSFCPTHLNVLLKLILNNFKIMLYYLQTDHLPFLFFAFSCKLNSTTQTFFG